MIANIPRKPKAKREQALRRITLNNAEEHIVQRYPDAESIVERIRCAIDQKQLILSADGSISILYQLDAAGLGAGFTIYVDELPVSTCYTCWDQSFTEPAWQFADSVFHHLVEFNGVLDADGYQYLDTPDAPWFTTVLLPDFIRLAEATKQTVAGLEPCIVWALWDNERGIGDNNGT